MHLQYNRRRPRLRRIGCHYIVATRLRTRAPALERDRRLLGQDCGSFRLRFRTTDSFGSRYSLFFRQRVSLGSRPKRSFQRISGDYQWMLFGECAKAGGPVRPKLRQTGAATAQADIQGDPTLFLSLTTLCHRLVARIASQPESCPRPIYLAYSFRCPTSWRSKRADGGALHLVGGVVLYRIGRSEERRWGFYAWRRAVGEFGAAHQRPRVRQWPLSSSSPSQTVYS